MKNEITGKILRDARDFLVRVYLSNEEIIELEQFDTHGRRFPSEDIALKYTVALYNFNKDKAEKERLVQEEKDKFKPIGTECYSLVHECKFNSGIITSLVLK